MCQRNAVLGGACLFLKEGSWTQHGRGVEGNGERRRRLKGNPGAQHFGGKERGKRRQPNYLETD